MLQDWETVLTELEEVSMPSPFSSSWPDLSAQGFPSVGVEIPREEEGSAIPESVSCASSALPGKAFFLQIQSFWCLSVPEFRKHTHPLGGNGLFWAIQAKLHSGWLEEAAQDYSHKHHSSSDLDEWLFLA